MKITFFAQENILRDSILRLISIHRAIRANQWVTPALPRVDLARYTRDMLKNVSGVNQRF